MARPNKRSRQSQAAHQIGAAELRSLQRHRDTWRGYVRDLAELTSGFKQSMGKERTFEENKIFLRIILREFQWHMRLAEAGEGKEKYFVNIGQDDIFKEIGGFYAIWANYLRRVKKGVVALVLIM